MASNLFDKYGIKEVADVTLYKIEREQEYCEATRKISTASVLKSALNLQKVYPLNKDGVGDSDGIFAYVFDRANVLTHFNYDCDDAITVEGVGRVIDLNNDGVTAPIFTMDDTTSPDYAVNWYNDDTDGYKNMTDAYLGNYMQFISAKDADFANDYTTAISTWLNNTEKYTVQNFEMSELELYDNSNIDKIFNATTDGDATTNIVAILNEAESQKGTDLPSEIHISVPLKDVNNWVVVYSAVKSYLLEEVGINMDIQDIYGIYSTFKADDTEETLELKITGGYYTFHYTNTDGDEVSVTIKINTIEDSYYVLTLPASFVEDFYNATDTSSSNDKKKAIEAMYDLGEDNLTISAVCNGQSYDFSYSDLKDKVIDDDSVEVYSPYANTLDAVALPIYQFKYTLTVERIEESETGIFEMDESEGHWISDPDYLNEGTHEFTYNEQVCLLFAKDQNLIAKTGARYRFPNPSTMFGDITFNDEYTHTPGCTDRVVICGLEGRTAAALYDVEEVKNYINESLTDWVPAKAYNVTYCDYAELLVEDEMGFYMPEQLGTYNHNTRTMTFFTSDYTYADWSAEHRGTDKGLANAVDTWGNDKHYSINDAIDALKHERYLLDGTATNPVFDRIFGGYKVKGKDADKDTEILSNGNTGRPYDDGAGFYGYEVNGVPVKNASTGEVVYSGYSLDEVLAAIGTMESYIEDAQLRVNNEVMQQSNRAIYVDKTNVGGGAGAYIYLLTNVKLSQLCNDTEGIFEFYDHKNNRVNYQDKVFAGTKYLALVVIGQSGLVFVADRHCKTKFTKVAWMIGDKGYITDKQGSAIAHRGLIHTVDVTDKNDSFDATCTVADIKIRKTKKNVQHYTPVLFLDTLKVSTIEQASENTDATGGQGNSTLMTWDYSKEITLSIEDALFSPASMSAVWGGTHGDVKSGIKDTKYVDRFEKIKAARSFIVPAGNSLGTPPEGVMRAEAVYFDPQTMEPYADGTPIAEGEMVMKFTRSMADPGESLGFTVEVSADGFPGIYRVVGETYIRDKVTGEDKRFQFIIPEAKMMTDDTSITLEADGDPVVFDFSMKVLRPDDGVMMKFVQFDTVRNDEEDDGSTMVEGTRNIHLLEDAELFALPQVDEDTTTIGTTEY